jgi:hypothetical protein
MKKLSMARLREMATTLELDLADDELARLLPMARGLLDVARRLRTALRERTADQSG